MSQRILFASADDYACYKLACSDSLYEVQAYDINDIGTVVGALILDVPLDPYHGFVWKNGGLMDLYFLGPDVKVFGTGGIARADSIACVGYILIDGAWVWNVFILTESELMVLPVPAGCSVNEEASAISDNGRYVIGECPPIGGGHCIPAFYDVLLGTAINLEVPDTFPEDTEAGAHDVNSSGVVVGRFTPEDETLYGGFVWEEGVMSEIENTIGGEHAPAAGINDKGSIVGNTETDAYMIQNGTMLDIGVGDATDVNARDWAVGDYIEGFSVRHAVLYRDGQVIELNSFLPDDLTSKKPVAINNYGWIVGLANDKDGLYVSWLLVPLYSKGDYDGDEDVDLHDAGHFMRCYAAEPYQGPEGGLHVGCSVFDFDDDVDLDLTDYAAFQSAFTGPITSGW